MITEQRRKKNTFKLETSFLKNSNMLVSLWSFLLLLSLSSLLLSHSFYFVICPSIPLTLYIVFFCILSVSASFNASFPFSDMPLEDQKAVCDWFSYFRWQKSLSASRPLLISVHYKQNAYANSAPHCSFKVYPYILNSVWCYYDPTCGDKICRGVREEEGWLLWQRTERWRRWQVITFESFL